MIRVSGLSWSWSLHDISHTGLSTQPGVNQTINNYNMITQMLEIRETDYLSQLIYHVKQDSGN